MSAEKPRIVVKRIVKRGGGHHGGAWKIAFADLMTAMMAFFLVMWLLAAATPKQRTGIGEYFRMPLKVALSGNEKSSSSSVIPGGGSAPTLAEGEVKRSEGEEKSAERDADADRMEVMKKQLDEIIDKSPIFKQFRPQILIDITSEGLRLQIVDSENRPMFQQASARLEPHMHAILRELGPTLNSVPNKINVSGHTDSTPYISGDKFYSNWELSADRANASRRELVVGGMAEKKVLRVMGLADSVHLDTANPRNPINRRISIIVLNLRTQERIERENSSNPGKPGAGQMPGEVTRAVPSSR